MTIKLTLDGQAVESWNDPWLGAIIACCKTSILTPK